MAFQDKTLVCRDCGKEFVWTASEQEFYASKGFQNAPVRCPDDRAAKKARMEGTRGPRQMFEITCSVCGKKDMVPFQPRGDRPVYCAEHFRAQRDQGQAGTEPIKADESAEQAPAPEEAPAKPEKPKKEEKEKVAEDAPEPEPQA